MYECKCLGITRLLNVKENKIMYKNICSIDYLCDDPIATISG